MHAQPSWLDPIVLPMPATLGRVNVYLIRGPDGHALIDTGMNDATSVKELEEALAARGLRTRDIAQVACTHYHADHAGLGQTFADLGAELIMSELDAESLEIYFAAPEIDEQRASFDGLHEVPDEVVSRVSKMFPFFRQLGERFEPRVRLRDGASLRLAGVPFEVLVTPGHTRGHLCLLQRDEGIVLTGDCVLARDATHVSMRAEARGTDPIGSFLDSFDRLGRLGSIVAYPGHGPTVPDLATRCAELTAHHRARLELALGALGDQPQRAYDISARVMGPRPKVFAEWLALSQTIGYLEHLAHQGLAMAVEQGGKLRYARTARGEHP